MTVWEPGQTAFASQAPRKDGTASTAVAADHRDHQPVFREAVGEEPALHEPSGKLPGVKAQIGSCDPALPPFGRDVLLIGIIGKRNFHAEEWLLIEWPLGEKEPTKYWISTLPLNTQAFKALVKMAKHRWIIERDYEELKQELGLGHFEGRNWRGFHHHATLCIAAYGFLIAERTRFSPSPRAGHLGFAVLGPAPDCPRAGRRVRAPRDTIRTRSLRSESPLRGSCSSAFLIVPFVDLVPDNPRHQYRHRRCTRRGGNDSARCATSLPKVLLR